MEKTMLDKIKETSSFIRTKVNRLPDVAVILGSGLGNLADNMQVETEIDYKEIPNFPVSTVAGHAGKLIFGTLGGKYIMAMKGRFHYYEGYDMKQVTFPVRVMKDLG
ncbi:MAG: purine-nucleoside phosphorylase, partial [Muribaculaceae bacterium]|nr:purine-nucleoside phosphorylase [Muribaculaceae bacterium]